MDNVKAEEQQNFDDFDSPLKRPSTSGTWKTTSSQAIYIEELEKMIARERERRIDAQNEVKRYKAGNSRN